MKESAGSRRSKSNARTVDALKPYALPLALLVSVLTNIVLLLLFAVEQPNPRDDQLKELLTLQRDVAARLPTCVSPEDALTICQRVQPLTLPPHMAPAMPDLAPFVVAPEQPAKPVPLPAPRPKTAPKTQSQIITPDGVGP